MDPEIAILLIAHGSREPRANLELHDLAARLHESFGSARVLPCYLEIERPDIPSAFEQAVEGGADSVIAFPYFLSTGAHVRTDIPAILADCASRHPRVRVRLARALGPGPELDRIVRDRIAEGGEVILPSE